MQKKLILLFVILISFCSISQAKSKKKKANKETAQWRYEIEGVRVAQQGSYLIKVWSYSKSPKVAIEQAKKNAVHGIIFKGFVGGPNRCPSQKPLVKTTNSNNDKYFKDFFKDGGRYMKFVSLSNDGSVGASDRLKISKREYKIGVIVTILKDQLRKELENDKIIKSLSSGF